MARKSRAFAAAGANSCNVAAASSISSTGQLFTVCRFDRSQAFKLALLEQTIGLRCTSEICVISFKEQP